MVLGQRERQLVVYMVPVMFDMMQVGVYMVQVGTVKLVRGPGGERGSTGCIGPPPYSPFPPAS